MFVFVFFFNHFPVKLIFFFVLPQCHELKMRITVFLLVSFVIKKIIISILSDYSEQETFRSSNDSWVKYAGLALLDQKDPLSLHLGGSH